MILLGTLKYLRKQDKETASLVNSISKDFLLARRADHLSSRHISDLFILGAAGVHEDFARVLLCLWLHLLGLLACCASPGYDNPQSRSRSKIPVQWLRLLDRAEVCDSCGAVGTGNVIASSR